MNYMYLATYKLGSENWYNIISQLKILYKIFPNGFRLAI